jgi:hypothetical protein
MTAKSKTTINKGAVFGKKVLSVAERILIELMEQIDDIKFTETHYRSIFSSDLRAERHESEEGRRFHEERMKRQAIKRLANQEYIKLREEGRRVICELTTNGKIKALKILIANSENYYKDGLLCVVSFDFPQAANEARRVFRNLLKSVGFTFVECSVWSIKKDATKEIGHLIELLKISRWVVVYEARL